jgi:hypothetical protein
MFNTRTYGWTGTHRSHRSRSNRSPGTHRRRYNRRSNRTGRCSRSPGRYGSYESVYRSYGGPRSFTIPGLYRHNRPVRNQRRRWCNGSDGSHRPYRSYRKHGTNRSDVYDGGYRPNRSHGKYRPRKSIHGCHGAVPDSDFGSYRSDGSNRAKWSNRSFGVGGPNGTDRPGQHGNGTIGSVWICWISGAARTNGVHRSYRTCRRFWSSLHDDRTNWKYGPDRTRRCEYRSHWTYRIPWSSGTAVRWNGPHGIYGGRRTRTYE